MKFQKLIIHNIASIEDAEIDFETQPLADSEVFLITGKTGAGKSTILDAICLALYANTPRLVNTKMQGDTKDGDKTVTIKDPRQLMRRNTGEAFVTLTFIGSNGVHYESTWSVARANKKADKDLQGKKWRLQNLDKTETLTREVDIIPEIQAAIGLDFNQFCRTTMLAQGEFTRFLNSKDDEKAEILEKITGVDIYSKIGAKVHEVNERKKADWEKAAARSSDVQILADEEVATKQNEIKKLEAKRIIFKDKQEVDKGKRTWIENDKKLKSEVEKAENEYKDAKKVADSEEFKDTKTLIEDWNTTIEARHWMASANNAKSTEKNLIEELTKLSIEFANLLEGQKNAEIEKKNIADNIKKIAKSLDNEKDKKSTYDNSQTVISHLSIISKANVAIEKSKEIITEEKLSLETELKPALEKAEKAAKEANESFGKDEAKLRSLECEIDSLNLPVLRGQSTSINGLLAKIKNAKDQIEALNNAKTIYEKTRSCLNEQKTALEKKKSRLYAMGDPIKEAKIKMDACNEILERQKDTIDKFASSMRLKLQIGDTCPVCRQEIKSALPQEQDLAALVGGLRNAYEESETKYNRLVGDKVKLEAEITSDSKAYKRENDKFNQDTSVSNAEQKALEACNECGIAKLDDNTLTALDDLSTSVNASLTEINDKIKDGEKKEGEAKGLSSALEEKRRKKDNLKENVRNANKKIDECNERIKKEETIIHTKQTDVLNAENEVKKYISTDNWDIKWKDSPKEFATALSKATETYNNNVQQKKKLDVDFESYEINCNNVSDVIKSIIDVHSEWENTKPNWSNKIDNLLGKANDIKSQLRITLAQLKDAKETYQNNEMYLTAFLTSHESLNLDRLTILNEYSNNDIIKKQNELKKGQDAVIKKETLYNNAIKRKNEHQQNKPELAENETIDTLKLRIEEYDTSISEIDQQKGALDQELKTNETNKIILGSLIKDTEDKKAEYTKWSRLNQLIGDTTGHKFRKIAQSYVLNSLIHSANSYLKTLTDRYTLKVTPGTFVISLEDAYQGYVSRAASTISGGESFLVSLSLALALSDIDQTLSVDTLFIDEGFGTLSGEPLQNAINTLRSLHTKAGRHVGIISHVEELQERIPVQIQVIQEGNNSSSKIKVVPEVI